MKTCAHRNFILSEGVIGCTTFTFTDKIPPEDGIGYHSDLQPSGILNFQCTNCDFERDYRIGKLPRWIQKHWDTLLAVQREAFLK